MSKVLSAPKSSAGWLWIAVAAFGLFTFGTKSGAISAGLDQGFSDTCAPFFASAPGEPPSNLSPGCDANGTPYTFQGSGPAEVAQGVGS